MKQIENKKEFMFITFLLAFCSLFYELIFSQLISIFIGSVIFSYSLGIGVFILGLGLGAFLCDRLTDKSKYIEQLFYIEIALAIYALIGLYVGIILAQVTTFYPTTLRYIIFFIPILAVGIVSGLELPLLMKIRNKIEEKFYVLGFDFVGMFVASLLFPIFFFTLGLFKAATTIAIINLLAAYRLAPFKKFGKEKLIVIFLLLIATLLWLFDSHLIPLREYLFLGTRA